MKHIPILFSTPMVQAILDGRKSMTRRIVKKSPPADLNMIHVEPIYNDGGERFEFYDTTEDNDSAGFWPFSGEGIKCPYGKRGDVLWVRERFTIVGSDVIRGYEGEILEETPQYVFMGQKQPHIEKLYKWKPGIHMPKSACRIFLEVVSVRVERLQEITEQDAIAEGIGAGFQMNAGWPDYTKIKNGVCEVTQDTAKVSFWTLWESINGKGSWESNPWVWVIEFKRVEKPADKCSVCLSDNINLTLNQTNGKRKI